MLLLFNKDDDWKFIFGFTNVLLFVVFLLLFILNVFPVFVEGIIGFIEGLGMFMFWLNCVFIFVFILGFDFVKLIDGLV